MNIIFFIIANLIVLISATIISLRFKINTIIDKILTIVVIGISQIILTELFLGVVIKRLYSTELILINLIILFASLIINKKIIYSKQIPKQKLIDIKHMLIEFIKTPLLVILTFLGMIEVFCIIYVGYNIPPTGWDEIWYHLTAVASWYQEGRISMLPMPSIWNNLDFINTLDAQSMAYHMSVAGFWYNVYPMNSELISLWNIIFLKNDMLVDLTQLPFTLIGCMGIYSLARKIDLKQSSSIIAGLLFLFTPIIIIQSRTAYVDIAFGAMTIIAANFLLGYIKDKHFHYAIITLISSGIVLGIKSSGIAFAGIFAIALLIIDFINNKYNIKRLFENLIIFGCIILSLGGFWYLRNIYYFGNPIFPYIVKIGKYTMLNGLGTVNSLIMTHNTPPDYFKANNLLNIITSWFEKDAFYSVDIRKAGFGSLWIVLEVPSIIFLIIIGIRKKINAIITITLIFCILFIIQPANWWTRYTIFIVSLGCIALAYLLEYFNLITKIIVSAIIVMLCGYTVITTLPYITPVDINVVMKIPVKERTIGNTMYSDYLWVENLKVGTKIGFAPMTFTYPLFTPTFKNKVYLVDGNTKEEWIEKIEQSGVEYITYLKGYLNYDKWIKNYPNKFIEIYNGQQIMVYKVVK